MVHSSAGYMVYTAYTFKNVFQYKENDVYWCTADIGWITGHFLHLDNFLTLHQQFLLSQLFLHLDMIHQP